jgi:hypothetical protein
MLRSTDVARSDGIDDLTPATLPSRLNVAAARGSI